VETLEWSSSSHDRAETHRLRVWPESVAKWRVKVVLDEEEEEEEEGVEAAEEDDDAEEEEEGADAASNPASGAAAAAAAAALPDPDPAPTLSVDDGTPDHEWRLRIESNTPRTPYLLRGTADSFSFSPPPPLPAEGCGETGVDTTAAAAGRCAGVEAAEAEPDPVPAAEADAATVRASTCSRGLSCSLLTFITTENANLASPNMPHRVCVSTLVTHALG